MATSYTKTTADPQREPITRRFWFHVLLVLLVCALFYIIFFSSLSIITRHGDDERVPNVTGQDVHQAMKLLEGKGFEVRVDSTYFPDKKAFIVLKQMPDVGDVVKHGRMLFLTVNKSVPPQTPMPNLVNLSFRSASMILKSNRLILGDTSYRPDIAEGAILDQLYQGKTIRPGQMIPQGSRIDLVIGGGLSNELQVPDVIGLTYPEAMAMLNSSGLQFTPIFDADVADSTMAKVYKQIPNHISDLGVPSVIRQGDFVDIYIAQNPSDSLMDANRNAWKKNLYNTTPAQGPGDSILNK
jgi:beta-lactam-binding protein with PASTA domain